MNQSIREIIHEVVRAILPIVIVVAVVQVVIVSMPWVLFARFLIGTALVMAGLIFFLQGVKIGLLPMGEAVGAELPQRGSLAFLLIMAFLLGFVVTLAEPDVRVLAYQVDMVSGEVNRQVLILAVALGVACFVTLAMLRIVLGMSIVHLLSAGYLLIIILSFFTPPAFVPISFDSGGVTTGPVTVPFILALGLGTVSVLGGRSSLSDGFGLVGLASIGPVISVMILGIFYG